MKICATPLIIAVCCCQYTRFPIDFEVKVSWNVSPTPEIDIVHFDFRRSCAWHWAVFSQFYSLRGFNVRLFVLEGVFFKLCRSESNLFILLLILYAFCFVLTIFAPSIRICLNGHFFNWKFEQLKVYPGFQTVSHNIFLHIYYHCFRRKFNDSQLSLDDWHLGKVTKNMK